MYVAKLLFYLINVVLHVTAYLVFCIAPFRKDFRFSKITTIILALSSIILFGVLDVLFFEKGSPYFEYRHYVQGTTLIFSFVYAAALIKRNYFQLLFIIIACLSFHTGFISISKIICFYFPTPSILPFFPEFNNLVIQFVVLLAFAYPLYYLSINLFSKVLSSEIDFLEWKFSILLPVFIAAISQVCDMFVILKIGNGIVELVFVLLFLLTAYFGYINVLKIFLISHEKHAEQAETALAKNLVLLQKESFKKLNKQLNDSARARHDWRHHYLAISGLIKTGDMEKAREYLEQYEKTHELGEEQPVCDNKTVDSVITHYLAKARADKVAITIKANIPENIGLDDIELCVIVGNILENAVEACHRQTQTERFLEVSADIVGKQFVFRVVNSYNGTVLEKNGNFYSAKAVNRLGIGLDSVKKIVQQNGGDFKIEYNERVFKSYVIMNL